MKADRLVTPCFVFDEARLAHNAQILRRIHRETGARVLLALKAFACPFVEPILRPGLHGASATSADEARLAREAFGGELHAYSAAFTRRELQALLAYDPDHIAFNSMRQLATLGPRVRQVCPSTRVGLRVNPVQSAQEHLRDAASAGSRFGVAPEQLERLAPGTISGLHVHLHAEDFLDGLEHSMARLVERCGAHLGGLEWVNLGGGQLFTHPDYDVDRLVALLDAFRRTWGVQLYLEPGQAVVYDAASLVGSVVDVVERAGARIAILDVSAAAHMPLLLQRRYPLDIDGAGPPDRHAHRYRLAGATCLSADELGEFSFPRPLEIGARIVIRGQADYTIVQMTTFNGLRPPTIYLETLDGRVERVQEFGYERYRSGLP